MITATLTPVPSRSPSPITAEMPSRTIPSTIARPEPAPVVRRIFAALASNPVDEHVTEKNVRAPAMSPSARLPFPRGLEGLRHELVGDGADQHAGAERHDQAQQTLRDPEREGQDSPRIRDEPARRPQPSAAPIQTASFTAARTVG